MLPRYSKGMVLDHKKVQTFNSHICIAEYIESLNCYLFIIITCFCVYIGKCCALYLITSNISPCFPELALTAGLHNSIVKTSRYSNRVVSNSSLVSILL